jgi:hypothetical protein
MKIVNQELVKVSDELLKNCCASNASYICPDVACSKCAAIFE